MKLRCLTLAISLLSAVPVAAQVTERPIAFDSIGRVPSITPRVAERLRLGPPLWPVLGSFLTARLYTKSTGGYTLVVARPDGAFDRYDLSGEAAEALRGMVETALASGARAGVGEQTSVASDPAGNAFVRNQALLGFFLYGPAAAAFAGGTSGDGSVALSAELLTASGAFAAALARRNMSPPVTTAQNNLSTYGALHGAALGEAAIYIAGGSSDGATHGAALLAGSIGGTLFGLHRARNMTDAEAAASAYAANFAAAGSLGILGAAGMLDRESSGRASAAVASAALVGGYVFGPSYPRRAPYTVTGGDVGALTLSSLIGVAAAWTPFAGDKRSEAHIVAPTLMAGMLAGALAGDRLLVRPRDHTASEATLLRTGAAVGAVVGGGVASLGNASAQPAWALGVAGALLGTAATEAAIHPRPGGRRILSDRSAASSAGAPEAERGATGEGSARAMQITFDPVGAVFAATSRIGTFSVLRVSF